MKVIVLLGVLVLTISLVNSLDVGMEGELGVDLIPAVPVNYSVQNTNSSDYWDGLDSPSDITGLLMSQISDLWSTVVQSLTSQDSYIVLNDTTDHIEISFNETKLNESIDTRTASTTYLPTQFVTVYGTESGGNNLGNMSYSDEMTFNVTEDAGANALELYINFTGVAGTPDFITMGHQYTGTHTMQLELWDYDSSSWEVYDTIVEQPSIIKDSIAIVDGANHVSGELVQARFIHPENGNPSHLFILDFLNIVDGWSTVTTTEHDGLSGRGDDANHPQYLTLNGSRNMTANLTITDKITFRLQETIDNLIDGFITINGNLNVTGDSYFGLSYFDSNVQIRNSSLLVGNISFPVGHYVGIEDDGDFKFFGDADYLVLANDWIFRKLNDEDKGLFLNATDTKYVFRNDTYDLQTQGDLIVDGSINTTNLTISNTVVMYYNGSDLIIE